jgi:threonine synthase
MGLPIDKFICASNENKVLTDFFETGVYDKKRELVLTESPSMDILVSSNLERLLFEASGRNCEVVSELMNHLNTKGVYEVNEKVKSFIKEFYGNCANTEEVYAAIKEVYEKDNYLMDTHTAVAYVVKKKYVEETKDDKPALILSTASPFKFPRSICNALDMDVEKINDFKVLEKLSTETNNKIPNSLSTLETANVLHDEVWDKSEMRDALLSYLNA